MESRKATAQNMEVKSPLESREERRQTISASIKLSRFWQTPHYCNIMQDENFHLGNLIASLICISTANRGYYRNVNYTFHSSSAYHPRNLSPKPFTFQSYRIYVSNTHLARSTNITFNKGEMNKSLKIIINICLKYFFQNICMYIQPLFAKREI